MKAPAQGELSGQRARSSAFASRIGASVALLVGGVFVLEAWPARAPIDDAFISFRYARNLAGGNGLVYNIGEAVEGYTNLLWTLLLAATSALSTDLPTNARVLEVFLGLGVLAVTFGYAYTQLLPRHAWLAAAAPAAVLAGTSLTAWSTSGLGEPLFVTLVATTFAFQSRGLPKATTAAAFAATLARPEGALVAVVALGGLVLMPGEQRRSGLRCLAAYGTGLAMLTAFRLGYYGAPVPNTFYAKVGGLGGSGGPYLADFLGSGVWPLLVPALIAAVRYPWARPPALYVLATFAYVVTIGGDVFSEYRFLLPVLPVLAVLAVAGAAACFSWRRTGGCIATALIALAVLLQIHAGNLGAVAATLGGAETPRQQLLRAGWEANEQMHAVSSAVARNLALAAGDRAPDTLVACGAVGALGWYADVRILDLFGLLDATIARSRRPPPPGAYLLPGHQRSDPDYVLARKPDYIFITRKRPANGAPATLDLWNHPGFIRDYSWDPRVSGHRRKPGLR